MADDRPRLSGYVPASGAPLNARTLALRPGGQILSPGDDNQTSSDVIANWVYSFLQSHPSLGVPEQGQQNLAEAARSANQMTPWGSTEEAVNAAKRGDIVGTSANLLGAVPIVGAAAKGGKVAKEAAETVASTLAKRAVVGAGKDVAESAAPAAVEAAAPVIKGRVRVTPAAAEPSPPALAPSVPDTVAATAQPSAPSSITDLPSLRRVPAAQGAEMSRGDVHLFPAEGTRQRTEGFFQGGPPNVNSLEELQALRERVYDRLAGNYRGADWYDRYRDDVNRLTGGDPNAAHWMTNTEALFSPQRAPPQEFNAALKETSGPIAGIEQRANFEPQHQKVLSAIAQNDPEGMIKGQKVGEYAYNNDPARIADPSTWSATGTNDFRHGIEFGFPRGSNIGPPQHQFLDYETAQLVDRANREGLGGRSDWTGEQIQAALWVRQKAEDIMASRPNLVRDRIAMGATPDQAYADAYQSVAFPEANSTLRESFPQHTLFATHEAQPFANIPYHMPASADADSLARQTFFDDPRSTWANAPGGRDALYAGLYPPDRPGAGMRVAPSTPMTGIYEPGEGKPIETNPGTVGQPMVGFNMGADKEKTLTDADRALIQAAESTRAFVDAQGGSAATKLWPVNALRNSNAYFTPLGRQATAEELLQFRAAGEPDFQGSMDTGQGMLVQNYEGPPTFTPAERKAVQTRLRRVRLAKRAGHAGQSRKRVHELCARRAKLLDRHGPRTHTGPSLVAICAAWDAAGDYARYRAGDDKASAGY